MAGLVDLGSALGGPLIQVAKDVLNRVLPREKMSEKEAADAELQMEMALRNFDYAPILGQLQINLEEAQSQKLFVSGWRPYIGWVCGTALLYHFLAQPCLAFLIAWYKWQTPPLPAFDMGSLMTILLGMLGLAGARTYEKVKGVSK
jgi:hypothetical protein